jgi:uncharacterized protein (TIGR00297 family)
MPAFASAVAGTALSALIAGTAWRVGSLSRSGAVTALFTGSIAIMAGPAWGIFLVAWFVGASAASRVGRRAKDMAAGDVVAKGGARDAAQVLANGGVFTACALGSLTGVPGASGESLALMGAASLVAAGADTLATETGTLWRGQPWSLRSRGPVPAGTSGAVSLPGTLGMLAGAGALAGLAAGSGLIPVPAVAAVALAGVAGAVGDTVIGAFWQARRWCPQCARETEQTVHRCGTATRPWRGARWLTNDMVNLLCTVIGALAVLGVTLSG